VTSNVPNQEIGHNLEAINNLRKRLNRKLNENITQNVKGENKGKNLENETAEGNEIDSKTLTWMEIQARSRGITLNEFNTLVFQKRQEVIGVLEALQKEIPNDIVFLEEMVSILQDAPNYYPGSTKELRVVVPLYKQFESRLEELAMFLKVSRDLIVMSDMNRAHVDDQKANIKKWNEYLETKKRLWGEPMPVKIQKWQENNYPFPENLLSTAQDWLFDLSVDVLSRSVLESSNWLKNNDSLNNDRQAKKVIDLMEVARLTLRFAGDVAEVCGCSNLSVIESSLDLSACYVQLSISLFESGKIKGRIPVMDHFEDSLKVLDHLKRIFGKLYKNGQFVFEEEEESESSENILTFFDILASSLLEASLRLCIFIEKESQRQEKKNELMLWLVFGCKYLHRVMSIAEKVALDDERLIEIMTILQNLEKDL